MQLKRYDLAAAIFTEMVVKLYADLSKATEADLTKLAEHSIRTAKVFDMIASRTALNAGG